MLSKEGAFVQAGLSRSSVIEDFGMQSPTVMEAGDEVLQVLEVCETVEEIKEVIVTTIEDDSIANLPPVASSGSGTKPSQVRWRDPAD